MFKQSRFFASAAMIAVLFVTLLVFSKNVSARRCPIEMPQSFLSLYMRSDQVVIADIADEKFTKMVSENSSEESFYYNVERRLNVIETFKGAKMNEFSFTKSEYRPNYNRREADDEEVYFERSARINVVLEKGKRYLFFLTKDEEGSLYPTDYRSGAREITVQNAVVLEKRLYELGKIVAAKKNQIPRLAEWLVTMTENEQTSWDGAVSLSRSFAGLSNEEDEEAAVLKLDKTFNEYSPAVAKQLSDSQKERLSSVLFDSLNRHFYGTAESYEYELVELVGNWDRTRVAVYGFGILQSIDKSNIEKTREIMNFIASVAADEKLYEISYEYDEAIRAAEETEDVKEVNEIAVSEGEQAASAENNVKEVQIVSEQSVEVAQSQPEAEKTSPEQLREQILQKFINRYQQLVARDFAPEPVDEKKTAEIITN